MSDGEKGPAFLWSRTCDPSEAHSTLSSRTLNLEWRDTKRPHDFPLVPNTKTTHFHCPEMFYVLPLLSQPVSPIFPLLSYLDCAYLSEWISSAGS